MASSTTSKATCSTVRTISRSKSKAMKPKPKPPPPKNVFQMPPMSITRVEPNEHELKILKRRNFSENEDPKMIKETLKQLKDKDIHLEEFIALIAKYTGDNGVVLIKVMADELAYFRKMVKKIYENMTQDMSDVLTNEQLQIRELYIEQELLCAEKIHKLQNEILAYNPTFNKEQFRFNEKDYLAGMFPSPNDEGLDEDAILILQRQEAYHRLQWLRSESLRLKEENTKLQQRFHEVKKLQKLEMCKARAAEAMAEEKQIVLETTQNEIEDKLDELNDSIEKAIVDNEKRIRLNSAETIHETELKKIDRNAPKKKIKPKWNAEVSQQFEIDKTESTLRTDVSSVSIRSKSAKKKRDVLQGKECRTTILDLTQQLDSSELPPPHYDPSRSPNRSCSPRRGQSMSDSLQTSLDDPLINRNIQKRTPPPPPISDTRRRVCTPTERYSSQLSPKNSESSVKLTISFSNVAHSTPISPPARSPPRAQCPCVKKPSPSCHPGRMSRMDVPVHQSSSTASVRLTLSMENIKFEPPYTSTQLNEHALTKRRGRNWNDDEDISRRSPRKSKKGACKTREWGEDETETENYQDIMSTPPAGAAAAPRNRGADWNRLACRRNLRQAFDEFSDDEDEQYSEEEQQRPRKCPPPPVASRAKPCAAANAKSRPSCRPPSSQQTQHRRSEAPSSRAQRRSVRGPQDEWAGPAQYSATTQRSAAAAAPCPRNRYSAQERDYQRRSRRHIAGPSDHPECFPGYNNNNR